MPFKKVFFYIRLFFILFFITASILITSYVYKNSQENIENTVRMYHYDSSVIINGYFEQFTDGTVKLLNIFFNDQKVLKSIHDSKKDELNNLISPFYKKYLLSEPSLWGMNIILNDGKTFIKILSSTPRDSVVEVEKSILTKALQSRKVQSGFENSGCGYFYKIIYPIFYNGKFLGVSEFSYKLSGFIDFIYNHYSLKAAFVYKEDVSAKDLSRYTKKTKDGYIVEYASPEELSKYLTNINIKGLENKTYSNERSIYSLKVFKLPDIKNSSRLVSFYDITDIVNESEASLYRLLFILIVCSIIITILVNRIISFFIKNIALKEAEAEDKAKEIYFNSRHNELTKLPNVNVMNEAALMHENYSVIMLNIDNVAIINTTYGKDVLESLFKESANYLELNLPSNAILYHMSAEEFAIILDKPSHNQEMLLSSQIKAYFEHTPMCVDDFRVNIQFSMGIGVHKEDDTNKLNVFSQANIALVEAKHRAKGLILMYSDDMSSYGSYTQLAKNISILQRDLENESLIPFYQPIVDSFTQKVLKYEVLARIKDETGFISPNKFMEAAEVSGLQTAITKQIMQKSFKYFEGRDLAFSINITKHDLIAKYLVEFLNSKTKKHNIKPQNVTLEILEDIAIEDNDEMIEQINFLSSLGYVIAIDDFGVESSNVSKLSDLDVDYIKIDGTFIKDMDINEKHLHIVESLVYMAKKLDMKVIAEHVHNEEIYNIVKELGIHYSQGYYFSPPKDSI